MEPSSFRRSPTIQQFEIRPDPHLVFDDYLENLSSGLNQTLFFHFVEKFKGIRSFVPADRKTAVNQLLGVLIAYFRDAGPHINSLGLEQGEYRSKLYDLLMTIIIVSGDEALDKKAILTLIHRMVTAYPANRDALFTSLGRQLSIDGSWELEGFEFMYSHYLETSLPREAHFEELSCCLESLSNLFWPCKEEFIVKYIAYHLLKDKQTLSELLDFLLIAAFRNRPERREPANPELSKAIMLVFTSSQFINLSFDAAIYHFQSSHNFFELPKEVTFAQCEGLLDCANKEQIRRVGFIEDQRKGVKTFSLQTSLHFLTTRQLQELFECFVNKRLVWDREAFRNINNRKLLNLFQRNIQVESAAFTHKEASISTHFFQTLILRAKEFCEAFALDEKTAIDHINCELFAGTCAHLQKNILRNVPLPVTLNPREHLKSRIKAALVNQKIVDTLCHLLKMIQEVDPVIHLRHKERLNHKIRLLNQKTVLIGSVPCILRFNGKELLIEKKNVSKPLRQQGLASI